jgi:murein L,D-transpeptidase YcbB/YkuD
MRLAEPGSRTFGLFATVLAGLLALAGPAPAAAQLSESALWIDLNIPTLRIDVFEHGELVGSYPVAVGQLGHDTPEGTFTLSRAEWNPWWRPPRGREWTRGARDTPPGPDNPMGRVKMFFAPLYYIHGTPDEGSLGLPASHGCVRMLNDDAIELATLIHDRASPVTEREIDRILADPRTTRNVNFTDSVTFTVRYLPVVIEGEEIVVYPDIYQRGTIHTEAVYQALLAAGLEVSDVDAEAVREFVRRARRRATVVRVALHDVFPAALGRADE